MFNFFPKKPMKTKFIFLQTIIHWQVWRHSIHLTSHYFKRIQETIRFLLKKIETENKKKHNYYINEKNTSEQINAESLYFLLWKFHVSKDD